MDIKCPHCGTEYEVEKKDMYHYTTCEVCGKGFVIGATTSLLSSAEKPMPASRQSASRVPPSPTSSGSSVPRSRPFAGKIGNVGAHSSDSSSKFNWRNPFMWISIVGMCLISMLIVMVAVLYTSNQAKDVKMKAMLSTSHYEPKQISAKETRQSSEPEALITATDESPEDAETAQIQAPIAKDKGEEENKTGNADEERYAASQTPTTEIVKRLCSGERLTYREWERRLRREIGIDKLNNALKAELSKAGYWAIRIESSGMQINVGFTANSTTGFIREGLDGGFTYPAWLPEEDAAYIYKAFWKLDAEEKSLWRAAEKYTKAFKDSGFYITPEEEERIEQTARLEYAKPLFSSLSFIEKPYLYIQQRLSLSVISTKITDRRWKLLQEAQSNEDWLEMMNIMLDDEADEKMDKYPDKEIIDSLYKKILDHKWNVEIKLKNCGVRTPLPGDSFREIAHSIRLGRKENEIVACYSRDNYNKYKNFKAAQSKMNSNTIPYPIDVEVSLNKVGRDGDVCNIHWCLPNRPRRFDGGNTVNFQFTMSEGATYLLYVDDEWFWKQHVADSLRAKMSKYMSTRNKYYSEIIKLANAVEHQQYGKREAMAKHKEISEKFRAPLLDAIANFMGRKSIVLPPMPARLNDQEEKVEDEDIEMEVSTINIREHNGNRFAEYEKEMREMEKLERMTSDNEAREKERIRKENERRRKAEKKEKYRMKGPWDN